MATEVEDQDQAAEAPAALSREAWAGLTASAAAGLLVFAAAFLADAAGVGGSEDFGWKQWALLFTGAAVAGAATGAGAALGGVVGSRSRAAEGLAAGGAALVFIALRIDGTTLSRIEGVGPGQRVGIGLGAMLIAAAVGVLLVGWLRPRPAGAAPWFAGAVRARLPVQVPALPRVREWTALRVASRVLAGVCAGAIAVRASPNVLLDDAPISFRYADRLAGGQGFTYNDHEHVLGASNPLYTLLLAALDLVGLEPVAGARLLALVVFVGVAVAVVDVAERLSNPIGGLLAAVILVSEPLFRTMALVGLEVGLASLLGVLVVAALLRERDVLAGVLLGLAVWNKIDAGLLAAAVAGAVLVVQRRFPWRVAAAAVLTVLPWTVFATIYFDSPVPNSFTAKLGHEETGSGGTDRTWILDLLSADWRWPLVALGAVATVAAFRGPLRHRVAVLALGGWFVMHALAYSLVDLGEPYPWYPTVLIPPLAVLGAAALARLAAVRARPAVAVAALAAFAFAFALSLEAGREALRSGYPLTPFEAFDTDRRLAGAWVERHGAPGEVIRTYFGWPAFEAPSHPINDMTLLNSKRMLRPPDYVITTGDPYNSGSIPPRVPRGYELLATFNLGSDMQVGYSWFTVVGRPDSAIARSRARFVQRRLFELRRRPYSARFDERSISFYGNDMLASGPSGAVVEVRNRRQPVRVRFSPRVVREGGGPPATFEVRDGKRPLRRVRVPPGGPGPGPVVVRVPAERRDRVRLGFVVDAPPKPGNATWGAASIVIGGDAPDLSEIESEKVVEAWRANKLGPVGRQ